MVQGEEIKAREFLNRILDFKHQFLKPEVNVHKNQEDDVFSKIDKLNDLKTRGIISEDEFEFDILPR
ncbi:MAG: Short C-terminal domain [Phormidium sp. OSCR]|nr:MAG: Short C-terminal domain [Phormidium sp. OSCR]